MLTLSFLYVLFREVKLIKSHNLAVNVEKRKLQKYKLNSSTFDPFIASRSMRPLTISTHRKMSKTEDSDEEKKSKKPKRTGPSLLQLEREKYLKGGAASSSSSSKVSKGKRKADDDEDVLSALDGFKKKLSQASKNVPEPKREAEEEKREKLHGIDLNDDELEDDDDVSSLFAGFLFAAFFSRFET